MSILRPLYISLNNSKNDVLIIEKKNLSKLLQRSMNSMAYILSLLILLKISIAVSSIFMSLSLKRESFYTLDSTV